MVRRDEFSTDLWLSCADPDILLYALAKTENSAEFRDQLRANVGERKLRLFAAACCRTIWDLLGDGEGWLRYAVETCEREADQMVNRLHVKLAAECTYELWENWQLTRDEGDPHLEAAMAVLTATDDDAAMAVFAYENTAAGRLKRNGLGNLTASRESMIQHAAYGLELSILRDIFNPFTESPFEGTVSSNALAPLREMARQIYDEQTFSEVPALADAFERANCTDTKLIRHCRQDEIHVRGCWALDSILGWK